MFTFFKALFKEIHLEKLKIFCFNWVVDDAG